MMPSEDFPKDEFPEEPDEVDDDFEPADTDEENWSDDDDDDDDDDE